MDGEWLDDANEPIKNETDRVAVDVVLAAAQEPNFLTAAAFIPSVLEKAPNGTLVVVAGGRSRLPVEYSPTNNADGCFDIDPLTGLITVEDGLRVLARLADRSRWCVDATAVMP